VLWQACFDKSPTYITSERMRKLQPYSLNVPPAMQRLVALVCALKACNKGKAWASREDWADAAMLA